MTLKKLSPHFLGTIVLFSLLAGCGGGGSTFVDSSNSGQTGGTANLKTITEDRRTQIITAVTNKWNTLPGVDASSDSQALLTYMKTIREFTQVGINKDNSVTGIFPDGRSFTLANNEPKDLYHVPITQSGDTGYTFGSRGAVPFDVSSVAPAPNTRATPTSPSIELPGGNALARLVFTFGLVDSLSYDTRRLSTLGPGIEGMLQQVKGYNIDVVAYGRKETTVSDLQSTTPITIFYTGTHGYVQDDYKIGNYTVKGHFVMALDQVVTPESNATLKPLLDVQRDGNGNIIGDPLVEICTTDDITGITLPDLWNVGSVQITRVKTAHYGLTPAFVKKYLHFAPNSVWYNDACEGGVDPNFYGAAFSNGLTAYLGWENEVYRPASNNIARFFFDRVAGTNLTNTWKATPPQRPFDWLSVYNYMEQQKITSTPGNDGHGHNLTTHLGLFSNGNSSGQFAPSISHIVIGAQGANGVGMTIAGSFGSTPGTVTVKGANVNVLSWSPNTIRCASPTTGGDVVVTANGHQSNPRRLTEWKLPLNYTESGPGSHSGGFNMSAHIIADIQNYRSTCGQKIMAGVQAADFVTLPDATCSFSTGGSWKVPDGMEMFTWSGGSTLTPGKPFFANSGFDYIGKLDPIGKSITLRFGVGSPNCVTDSGTDAAGKSFSNQGPFSITEISFNTLHANPVTLGFAGAGNSFQIQGKSLSDSYSMSGGVLKGDLTMQQLTLGSASPMSGTEPDNNAPR